jgi:mono/diheme cytochrome c family protein
MSLPPGTAIDVKNVDAWVFPVGTKFWKEFVVAGRKVETRLLWRASTAGWVYATYKWNADQTAAELADPRGDVVEVGPGERPHAIPSMDDCRACHESRRTEVLGFTALQLSTDRDPNAIHGEPLQAGMTTLDTLARDHLLTPDRPELLASPPRIAAATPRERAVLGYLSINCGICHNADGPLAEIGMHLKQPAYSTAEVNAALRTTVGVPASWQIPGGPMPSHRVIPGAADLSALMVRMRSRRPASQMPPLGTAVPDREAIAAVADWIQQLGD